MVAGQIEPVELIEVGGAAIRVGENYKVKMAKLQTKLQKRPLRGSLRRNSTTILAGTCFPPNKYIPPNRLQFPAKSTGASRHKDAASRQDDLWLPTKTGITHSILVGLT